MTYIIKNDAADLFFARGDTVDNIHLAHAFKSEAAARKQLAKMIGAWSVVTI